VSTLEHFTSANYPGSALCEVNQPAVCCGLCC